MQGVEHWITEVLEDGTESQKVMCNCSTCYGGDDCDLLCNSVGTCNDTLGMCDCGFDGMRGPTCEEIGCPGWGESCTGHGSCNPVSGECSCNPGWEGTGCHIVTCEDDCNGQGECMAVDEPYCACYSGYFGSSCAHYCYNGNITTDADGEETCTCDPCYNTDDIECNTECSGQGSCFNGTCDCGTVGWRGEYCQKPGCPGTAGSSNLGCSAHGSCLDNIGKIGSCVCDAFWFGDGCDVAICLNNCSGNGSCNAENAVPFCECYEGYMSEDCSVYCHGDVVDGECVCRTDCEDQSDNCEKTCNDIGTCVDGQCQCYNETGFNSLGYWGDRCTDETCPGYLEACSGHGFCAGGTCTCIDQGWLGDYCHLPDCPGYPTDCNGLGSCNITTDPPSCNCYDGYMGAACESECVNGDPNEDGSECICHSCYTGDSCSETCSGRGSCTNDTCLCDSGWWGKFIKILLRYLFS